MPFGEQAVSFEFTSDRFDHSSELPPELNAGKRFYGRDVAELVSEGLGKRGYETSFIDEDWGWQAHARKRDGAVLEVSIHHNHEEDPATPDDWALLVRLLHKEKLLGVVSRFREAEVGQDDISALEGVFRDGGIELRRVEG